MNRAVILRYHEIALKGGNRRYFEEKLASSARKIVKRALPEDAKLDVRCEHSRIVLDVEWNETVKEALQRVFGMANFSPMRSVPTNLEDLQAAALEEFNATFANKPLPKTFRVFTRRTEKALPQTSMEIDRAVGSVIANAHPSLQVNLDHPEFTLGVELRFKQSFIWTQKIPGPGGLPVGSNGHLLALLSGGLDSPVAAIQSLKRGATTSFLHFYGTPFVGTEVLEKVEDLARLVNRFHPDPMPLYVVPFGKFQEKIALVTNPKMRTVLYRRMMIRIACAVAKKIKAMALVTGESLGQVASQTLENLTTIDAAADMTILRPLIMMDKEEIIERAQAWGTYETAIRPGVDCCTLFADRHPSIRTTIAEIEEQEALFPVQEFVEEAVRGIEKRWVT